VATASGPAGKRPGTAGGGPERPAASGFDLQTAGNVRQGKARQAAGGKLALAHGRQWGLNGRQAAGKRPAWARQGNGRQWPPMAGKAASGNGRRH